MIEDVPIISINVKILKFWSYILVHNWRRYLGLVPASAFHITQFLDMYYSEEKIDAKIRNTYFLVLWFNTILRAIVLIIQHKRYEEFMETLEIMYNEISRSNVETLRKLLKEGTIDARRFSIVNLFLGALVSVGFGSYPIFASTRVLPFGMTIPGIKKYESPYYEVLFLFQMVITPMGCCMYIPFTSLLVNFIQFAIILAKVLQYRLRNLRQPNDTVASMKIKMRWCLEYHKKIIRYVNSMNDLVTYLALLEFVTYGATLCALLFLLNIVKSFGQMSIVAAYILMIFTQIFGMYWYANEMFVQNSNIAHAAYDAPWFDYDTTTQKSMLLIIMRAQRPLTVTVGNMYPMSLEVFQSLLNATYSYFTLLRRMYA